MAQRYPRKTRPISSRSSKTSGISSGGGPRLKLAIKPFVRPPAPPPTLYQDTIPILINALNAILKHEPLYLSRNNNNNKISGNSGVVGRSTSPKAVILSNEDVNNDTTCSTTTTKKEIISREELYRMVENLCVHNHSKQLYDDVKQALKHGCYECICKLLHTLPQFTTSSENNQNKQVYITSLPNNDASNMVLVAISNVYKEYMEFVNFVRSIFLYLDRTHCVQNNLSLIVHVGIEYFRQAFVATSMTSSSPMITDIVGSSTTNQCSYHTLAQTTIHSLLLQIQRERNGEVVDRNLLRSTISMLVTLNLFDSLFLNQFTSSSEQFFKNEGIHCITNLSGTQFLHHIQHRIKQGHDMQVSYLSSCSNSRFLVTLIDTFLFQPHLDIFLNKYLGLLLKEKEDHFDDLRLLCLLVKRIQSLPVLKKSFVSYGKVAGNEIAIDPNSKEVIDKLLQFKLHLESLPFFTLYNDVFADSLRSILEHVLNVSEARGRQMAELTARHMDQSLRSKNIKDVDTDSFLDSILSLFRYLNSKDVFEAFYKRHLAKRLLTHKSASVDLEKSFLSKLKAECGTAYTAKMEGMFKDVSLSREIMAGFNDTAVSMIKSVGPRPNSKLDIQILTTGYWPIYPAIPTLIIPSELQSHIDRFETFYSGKYQGRRIKWQHGLGNCTLKAHFNAGEKTLEVSQYQAIILVSCYNTGDGYNIAQIMEKTGLDEPEAERTLLSLACGKTGTQVLSRKDHNTPHKKKSKQTHVHAQDTFHFNANFTSNLSKIRITSIQRKETAVEREKTHETVTRDRLYFIDAAIVRIMKARKTMDHQSLKGEVLSQLRFPMDSQASFKKRIESLIEREYLERADDQIDRYNYLA